jgi:DNA repair protein RadD
LYYLFLNVAGRATQAIVKQIVQLAKHKQGTIIFAATVRHADEIMALLSDEQAGLITALTPSHERDEIIDNFKRRQLKYLVNVAVLTTGFDAPHVDLIAILRPTASVSLFQQMVGRGLRICEGKTDCLVIDYAANGFDLFFPEVGQAKPDSKSVPVQVHCPVCHFANIFWGLVDDDGDLIEHFGRRCQAVIDTQDGKQQCDFRFRSKSCPYCGEENDIAAKICQHCDQVFVDPDKRLKEVLQQKHHHLFRCQEMLLERHQDRLRVRYLDIEGNDFNCYFNFQTPAQIKAFYAIFVHQHTRTPGCKQPKFTTIEQAIAARETFRSPDLLLLKKGKKGWELLEQFFDYQGRFHTENKFV